MDSSQKTLISLKNKQDLFICCLQETHFGCKYAQRLKMREWKEILHANWNDKEAEVVILILDKILKQSLQWKQRRALYNDKGINRKITYIC